MPVVSVFQYLDRLHVERGGPIVVRRWRKKLALADLRKLLMAQPNPAPAEEGPSAKKWGATNIEHNNAIPMSPDV